MDSTTPLHDAGHVQGPDPIPALRAGSHPRCRYPGHSAATTRLTGAPPGRRLHQEGRPRPGLPGRHERDGLEVPARRRARRLSQ